MQMTLDLSSQRVTYDLGVKKKNTFSNTNYYKNYFSRGVGPACLPFSYQNFAVPDRTVMTAIGWGSTEFSMTASADKKSWILKKVLLTVNSTLPLCKGNGFKLCTFGNYNPITKQSKDSCQVHILNA